MISSYLPSQIGTNYIPNEEEILYIKTSLLPGPASKLKAVEVELNRITALYNDLSTQRQDLCAEIDGYRALISPARRLPVDILQEIFIHTLPTAHNALINSNECPLLLTRICSGWRRIALTTPYLWSTIHIPIPTIASGQIYPWGGINFSDFSEEFKTSSVEYLTRYATLVTNWLNRSGACPLSISLFDPCDSFLPKEYYDILVDSFLQFSTRWKNLVLDSWSPHIERLADVADSDVPLLERLTIRDFNSLTPASQALSWKDSGLIKAPCLREIACTQVMDNIINYPLKWGQLTLLKLTQSVQEWGSPANTSLSDIALMLSMSPRLISCHFEISLLDRIPGDGLASSSLSLPSLQNLVIHDGGVDLRPLFELLEVPSLLHLEYYPARRSGHFALSALLPRTATAIIYLSTSYHFFTDFDHYKCLSGCHDLRTLTVRSPTSLAPLDLPRAEVPFVGDDLLDNLILRPTDPRQFAPAIEIVDWQSGASFTDAGILRFIKAKQSDSTLTKLKRLTILLNFPREFDIFEEEQVREFIKGGLDLYLSYPPGLNSTAPFAFMPSAGVSNIRRGAGFDPWLHLFPHDL